MADYIIGVDLGQAHDFTAIVVLECAGNTYNARHLERLPTGTPYPQQIESIKALNRRLQEMNHRVELVVDQTGVGRPVLDMMRHTGLEPQAVTITLPAETRYHKTVITGVSLSVISFLAYKCSCRPNVSRSRAACP